MRSRAERMVLEMYLKGFRAELSSYLGLAGSEEQTTDAQLAAAAASDRLLKSRNIGNLLGECSRFTVNDSSEDGKKRPKGRKDIRKLVHLVEKIEEVRKEIK